MPWRNHEYLRGKRDGFPTVFSCVIVRRNHWRRLLYARYSVLLEGPFYGMKTHEKFNLPSSLTFQRNPSSLFPFSPDIFAFRNYYYPSSLSGLCLHMKIGKPVKRCRSHQVCKDWKKYPFFFRMPLKKNFENASRNGRFRSRWNSCHFLSGVLRWWHNTMK